MPFTFDVGRIVPASPDAVWDLITDTTRWAEWSPTVAAVECDDRHVEAGSEGRVQTRLGLWVAFVVTDFEPGTVTVASTGPAASGAGQRAWRSPEEDSVAVMAFTLVARSRCSSVIE